MDVVHHVYANNEDYKVGLEVVDEETVFVHIDVQRFNRSVLKGLRADLEGLLKDAYDKGLDQIFFYTDCPKVVKLAGMVRKVEGGSSFEEQGKKYMMGGWSTF